MHSVELAPAFRCKSSSAAQTALARAVVPLRSTAARTSAARAASCGLSAAIGPKPIAPVHSTGAHAEQATSTLLHTTAQASTCRHLAVSYTQPFAKLPGLLYGLVLWLSLFVLQPLFAQEGNPLQNYLQLATDSNAVLQQKRLQAQIAEQQAVYANQLAQPQLSLAWGAQPIETRLGKQVAKFSVVQRLPWPGLRKAQSQMANHQATTAEMEYQKENALLHKQVSQAWYKLFALRKSIALSTARLQLMQQRDTQLTQQYTNRQSSLSAVLRHRLALRELETQLLNLQTDAQTAQTTFNLMLGLQADTQVSLPDSIVLTAEHNSESDWQQHPALRAMQGREMALEQKLLATRLQNRPAISLGFDYSLISAYPDLSPEGNGRDALMPMLALSLPIWGRSQRARIAEAELNVQQGRWQLVAMQRELQNAWQKAENETHKARQNLKMRREQWQTALDMLRLSEREYTSATVGLADFLAVKELVLAYELAYWQALAECASAEAELTYLQNR